jgi:hypothetical protein
MGNSLFPSEKHLCLLLMKIHYLCFQCRKARDAITTATGNANVHAAKLDLSSQKDVKRFAKEIDEKFPRLNYLINNAGMIRLTDVRKVHQNMGLLLNFSLSGNPLSCPHLLNFPCLLPFKQSYSSYPTNYSKMHCTNYLPICQPRNKGHCLE